MQVFIIASKLRAVVTIYKKILNYPYTRNYITIFRNKIAQAFISNKTINLFLNNTLLVSFRIKLVYAFYNEI